MLPNPNLISCNFSSSSSPSLLSKTLISRFPSHSLPDSRNFNHSKASIFRILNPRNSLKTRNLLSVTSAFSNKRWGVLRKFRSYVKIPSEEVTMEEENPVEKEFEIGGNGGDGDDWTTSILLFGLWAVLMYYVFMLAPDQTPSTDVYFLKKLLNLSGNDGFKMNEVLVSLWYLMGLWPLVYSMLLLPSGRSSRSNNPVWPFLVLSCFGGAYVLLPYFVLWKPPPPPVDEAELDRWPLSFLESKLTAGVVVAAGLGLITYAGLAGGAVWTEFFQYFRGSKFIHVMSIDFTLLSAFAPFWVYNDLSARKGLDKGTWLLPLALIPFLGPALYIVLRPPVSAMPISLSSTTTKKE